MGKDKSDKEIKKDVEKRVNEDQKKEQDKHSPGGQDKSYEWYPGSNN
ncbi:MAG TPA: hypothetical protein VJ044_05160 [Candidatus Hodarchaeales archaeon]|nr:hypothetical protein [Candidatus Hodarchaeales archaeon]